MENLIMLIIIFGTLTVVGLGMILASIDNPNTENFKLGDLFKLTMINVFMIFVYSLPLLILFFVLWSL